MIRPWLWRLTILLLLVALAGFYMGHRVLQQPLVSAQTPLLVAVAEGDTPGHVLQRLAAGGHLHNARLLRLWIRLRVSNHLQAGEYEIPAGLPAIDVIEQLMSGKTVQRSFTIIEGWSIRQLRAALAADSRLVQASAKLSDAQLMAVLDVPGLHPEGRFAPDTYFFSPLSTTDIQLLRRAFIEQQYRIATIWSARATDLPYKNSEDMLIMASIVEKETGQAHERPDIAGVFVRRLQIGMRLQTDPTVIYGLGDAYAGNITRAHLLQPTPWNTYVISGLPPTPIAMPGREALRAAAHPAAGSALYFVGRGDGSHQFSATLEAHNKAVRQYQMKRRADYRSAPVSPSALEPSQRP